MTRPKLVNYHQAVQDHAAVGSGFSLQESIDAWGWLVLEVYKVGRLVDRIVVGRNVVTNAGKAQLLRVIGGVAGATAISRMGVGDGGCGLTPPISSLFTPVAFAVTDTDLRSKINFAVNIQAGPVVDEGAKTVAFTCFLNSAGVTGNPFHYTPHVINEIALLSGAADDKVVALRSFRSIPFDVADAVEVKAIWTIGMT